MEQLESREAECSLDICGGSAAELCRSPVGCWWSAADAEPDLTNCESMQGYSGGPSGDSSSTNISPRVKALDTFPPSL